MTEVVSTLQSLNEALLFEISRALGFAQSASIRSLVRLLFGAATRKISKLALELDHAIEQHGSAASARWLLPHFVFGYEACGQEIIPATGPLLIVSNHPAAYDGLLIASFINRPDFKIIIGRIPPYEYLPHLSQHAIFSPSVTNTFGRMQTVRDGIQHLKRGGSLLMFPRGGIEPDPAFMPNPGGEFVNWSRSVEIFLQRVPQTQVLVTIVSGVIAPAAMRHPITWFRKARPDRQRLAFMYQMIRQVLSGKELFGLKPNVSFGELLSGTNPGHVLPEIELAARRTLVNHMKTFYPQRTG